ncbi:MAG: bifunctional diaminohydroxyphosphoribosylaminopyrimidine deaminase/5-amino-6-(5-phosphoribosylamino)uracil reductase RibD [Phycisphaerae bacterium]|nr:bifunctional diaminohydroxyphosphoribosylaminopyrimidine deaminase/5-amino-6-(5-phosphoribosylamino)uracil reductase RibD [Phycisphaerae bacterium]
MHRAIRLSLRGQGRVEPNPMVGCVIVRRGKIVGEGWHQQFGGPHAEVRALAQAGAAARGATAYVSLEPCSHFGKTPPCADALIAAGIGRVVAAVRDPNPLVSGKGFAKLRRAGVQVDSGLCRSEASDVLAPFLLRQHSHRPYFILKWAQSIDGRIATRTGDSKWITSLESRRRAHALRARVDAIVVGIGTILADDPELTARFVKPRRIATRVVIDRYARTPLNARVVITASVTPTIIAIGPRPSRDARAFDRRVHALKKTGCALRQIAAVGDLLDVRALAADLHSIGFTNVMVEGGGRVLGSFVDEGLADEAWIFVAPILIGGVQAAGPLNGLGPARIADASANLRIRRRNSGRDLWYKVLFDFAK